MSHGTRTPSGQPGINHEALQLEDLHRCDVSQRLRPFLLPCLLQKVQQDSSPTIIEMRLLHHATKHRKLVAISSLDRSALNHTYHETYS